MFDLKTIHIGSYIKQKATELEITVLCMSSFLGVTEDELAEMFDMKSMDTQMLLCWSKLLEYNFFRLYSQHLILYAPASTMKNENGRTKISARQSKFRKNFYTPELIDFVIELVEKKIKTREQIINDYAIPKSTLFKWLSKYEIKIDSE